MNSLVQFYRQQFPEDKRSDEDIMGEYAQAYPQEELAQYPDFMADWQKVQQRQAVESSSMWEEAKKGFSRGLTGLEASGAGALALASDAVGADGAKEFWRDVYKRKTQQLGEESVPSVPTVQQAVTSLPAAGQYVAGKAGELVPNIGEALGFAALGTAAAPGPGTEAGAIAGFWTKAATRSALRRMVEKLGVAEKQELEKFAAGEITAKALSPAAAKAVETTSKYLAGVGASAANFSALGAGGSYGELSQREGVSPEDARTGALIAGAGASIGAIIPASILKGIFGEEVGEAAARNYTEKWLMKVPEPLLAAGGGMGAMEFFNILGERYADPQLRGKDFTKEEWSRLLNAAATGVIAGAPAAGIQALRGVKVPEATVPRETIPPPPPPAGEPPPPGPSPKPPAAPAEGGVASNYPVPPDVARTLRQVAEEVATGKLSAEEEEAMLSSHPEWRVAYTTIKSEVSNAIKTREEQLRVQQQRERDDAQLRKEEEDRQRAAGVEEESAKDGAGGGVPEETGGIGAAAAQAFAELDPATKEKLRTQGVTEEKLTAQSTATAQAVEQGQAILRDIDTPAAGIALSVQGSDAPTAGTGLPPSAKQRLQKKVSAARAKALAEPEKPAAKPKEDPDLVAQSLGFKKEGGAHFYTLRTANGYVQVEILDDRLHILGLGVGEGERSKGQGSELITAVKKLSDVTGKPITLTAHAETPSSQERLNRFYERSGFTKSGEDPLSKKPFYQYKPTSGIKARAKAVAEPEEKKQAPDWLKEKLKEREAQGWDPKWPFVPADLLNKTFREGIIADPTLSVEEKTRIMKFAGPEGREELKAFLEKLTGGKEAAPKPEPTPAPPAVDAGGAVTKVKLAADITDKGVLIGKKGDVVTLVGDINESTRTGRVRFPDGKEYDLPQWDLRVLDETVEPTAPPDTSWLSNVVDAISAWRTPRPGKEETDMYSDLGRDAKNKSRTRALGVFRNRDTGQIIVASIYDNNGKKVFWGVKGHAFQKTVDRFADPIGYIKTTEPQEKFYREYTPEQWGDIQKQLEAKLPIEKKVEEPAAAAPAASAKPVAAVETPPAKPVERVMTAGDAAALHDALLKKKGLPKPDEMHDMVLDTIGETPSIGRRIAEISGGDIEVAADIVDRIVGVYDKAAKSGETDPSKLREAITKELVGIGPEISKGETAKPGEGVPPDTRQSRPVEPSREPGRNELAGVAQHVIQRLVNAGIPVRVAQGKLAELIAPLTRSLGQFNRTRNVLTYVLSDLSLPTSQDIRVLFEEATHALFDREGPEVQQPILRAISQLEQARPGEFDQVKADIAHAYPEGVRPEVYQEELMAGWITRKLQAEGFNPVQAQGIGQSIVRLLKEIYLQSAMWFQRTFLGDQYTNPDLALRYFQNRLEGFMAGDKAISSWIQMLGGPKAPLDVQLQWHTPVTGDRDLIQTYNLVTGQIDTGRLVEDTVEAAIINSRGDDVRYAVPAPGAPQLRPVDPSVQLNIDVAANNEVKATQDEAAAAAHISREALRKLNGLTNTDRIAAVKGLAAQEQNAANFDPNQRISGFSHERNVKMSAMSAIRGLAKEFGKLGRNLAQDKELKTKLDARLPGILRDAERELDEFTDARFMGDQIEKGVRQLSVEDLRRSIETSRALGTITQVYQQLEKQIDKPVDPRFINALRRLYQGPNLGDSLFNVLDFMANDPGIDFTRPAATIKAYLQDIVNTGVPNDMYERLVQDTPEAKTLLSTVIAYGKTHQRILANLEMRRMKSGEERVELQQKLKDVWKETREQITSGIRNVAKSAKLEERARGAYRETLGRVMTAKKSLEHLETRIAVNEQAIPVYQKALDRLNPKIQQAVKAEFEQGATIRLPKTLEVRPSQWEEVTLNLDSTKGPISDMVALADRLAAWTKLVQEAAAHGDDTALTEQYESAMQQLRSLVNNRFYQQSVNNSQRMVTELVLGPAPNQIESIGTPAAVQEATLLRKAVSDTQVLRNEADTRWGYRNPRLKRKVLGILNEGTGWFQRNKVDVKWFNDYIKNAAFGFMEKMQFSEGGHTEAELNDFYGRLGEYLLSQDHIRPVIQSRMGEFMPALRAWMEAEYEAGQWFRKQNDKAGLLVEEPKLGGKLRSAIPAGARTFQRYFSPLFSNVVHALRLSGWTTNGKDKDGPYGDFSKFRDLYHDDPAAAQQMVDKYFNHPTYGDTVQKDFFHRLTHVQDESPFESIPLDDAGTTVPVSPELVARAYDESGGHVIRTFERLFELQNGQGDPGQYVQDALLTLVGQFQAMHSALNKVEPRSAAEVSSFVNLVPNAMIDARQFPHWPAEYFDYHEFDRNTNARMAERIAAQWNFGRDTRDLAALHDVVAQEVKTFQSILENALREAGRYVPSGDRKKIDAAAARLLDKDKTPALSKFKTGEEKLKYLRKIEERGQFAKDVLRGMADYYQRGSDQNGSLRWGIRFAQAMAGLLVNNPASAISQLATMFDIPIQWGASPMMLKASKRAIQMTAKDIAGGLAQGVGWEFLKLNEYERRFVEMGLNDPEVKRRFGDIFAWQEGEVNNPWSRRFRIAKELQSFSVNLKGEAARYTPTRPLAPFFQTVMNANRGLTVSLWELADSYVSRGVEYLKAHPGTKELTADMLGLKGLNKDSFEQWKADAARYGFRFTESVGKALDRINSGDKTLLTNDELGKLYSLGLNAVSLEANIATMPLAAFNNNVLRFVLPLLGWSYRRALQVTEKLGGIDSTDQRNLKAVRNALLGIAATGLGGLGLSLAVDAYQEDVVGKKRNIRALRFPTTGSDWLAIQERLNRIGTLGMWGELINGAVNVGTGQGDNRMLSMDQRVVALQSFQAIQKAIASFINQDFDPDYKNVVRPMIAALGGNGMLQYMQIANNAFDLDNVESRTVRRINAENYLRVVGRDLGMSIRTGGGGYNTPTPITPWIARMEYAAYANDPEDFRDAYRGALEEAKRAGKANPAGYVKQAFETRHPLRYVFAQVPSDQEYRLMLGNMDERGQESVTDAIRLFNYYGSHLGITPFLGSSRRRTTPEAAAVRARALSLAY